MSLAYQSLLMMVLLVCSAATAVPMFLLPRNPRLAPASLNTRNLQPGLFLIENGKGEWFVNGTFQPKKNLVSQLQSTDQSQVIRYLPSDALELRQVAASLRWLRGNASGSVVLEIMPP